jgi:hypothetical protein
VHGDYYDSTIVEKVIIMVVMIVVQLQKGQNTNDDYIIMAKEALTLDTVLQYN